MSDLNRVAGAFQPFGSGNGNAPSTLPCAATATSQTYAISRGGTGPGAEPVQQVQIYNSSTTSPCFVSFGMAQATTVATVGTAGAPGSTALADYVVAPGAVVVATFPGGAKFAAVIMGTGIGTVYLTPGTGV